MRTKTFRMCSLPRRKPAMLTDSLAGRLTEIHQNWPSAEFIWNCRGGQDVSVCSREIVFDHCTSTSRV
jgi:hypothetical protein